MGETTPIIRNIFPRRNVPDSNQPKSVARQQQIFQIWIRPVEPENGLFALRGALFELDKLVKNGLTEEQFESTREFLSKYETFCADGVAGRTVGYELGQ